MDTYYIASAAECVQRVNDEGKGVLQARMLLDWEEATVCVSKNKKLIGKAQAPCVSQEWLTFVRVITEEALRDLSAQEAAVEALRDLSAQEAAVDPDAGEEVEA